MGENDRVETEGVVKKGSRYRRYILLYLLQSFLHLGSQPNICHVGMELINTGVFCTFILCGVY